MFSSADTSKSGANAVDLTQTKPEEDVKFPRRTSRGKTKLKIKFVKLLHSLFRWWCNSCAIILHLRQHEPITGRVSLVCDVIFDQSCVDFINNENQINYLFYSTRPFKPFVLVQTGGE